MGKRDRGAVRLWHQRDRHPSGWLGLPFYHGHVQHASKLNTVAGVLCRGECLMVLTRRHMFVKPGPQFVIGREAPASQNDAFAGSNRHATFGGIDDSTAHPA